MSAEFYFLKDEETREVPQLVQKLDEDRTRYPFSLEKA